VPAEDYFNIIIIIIIMVNKNKKRSKEIQKEEKIISYMGGEAGM
jgi:hypothetical protein